MNSASEPSWEWYRSFLGVIELGSLSAAGRALGLSQPTVGRHVDALESALGLKLFTRSLEGYNPTDAGLELKPYAAGINATAAALRRAAAGQGKGVSGAVRLTASEVIGVEVLPPILTQLRRQHPGLTVELMLSNRVDDLLHREADIAVRMTAPTQDALLAKKLGAVQLGLYAHRSYLARYGRPKTLEQLSGHSVIGFDRETDLIRQFQKRVGGFSRSKLAFRADSDLAQLAAIRAGFGIGICQTGLAKRGADLVRLLPREFSLELETWVAMHEDLRGSPRCAVTFQQVAAGVAAYIKGQR